MPEIGDKIVRNNTTYVYIGYGRYERDTYQAQVVDNSGIAADVEENPNTENNELLVNLQGHICLANSTETPLGAGGTFTGTSWQSTLDYGVVSIDVATDQNSATDGLVVQWSSDGENVHNTDVFTISANKYKTFTFGPANLYVRVFYTNGSTPQTFFRINTILKKTYVKPSSHRISDSIVADDDAELVKSVLAGETPSGSFVNFQATARGNFKVAVQEYGDTPSIDPFGRLRVSAPYTIFDSKQLHDKQPLFWDEIVAGSATSTHVPADAATVLAVTASASDYAMRQTKQRFNYQPGKGFLFFLTFYSPQAEGVTSRIGVFDGTGVDYMTPNNGIFFQCDGTLSWNIAKNGSVTETVNQASWNVDTLDGNGVSGKTLNVSSVQIAIIDFEWLGVGRVRVGFVIDGLVYYCHYFNHSNMAGFTSVYMSTPNLPVRYDIQTDGTSASELHHICSTAISEGGVEGTGILRSVNTGFTHIDASAADTTYAVIGVRLKDTYKDVTVTPEYFSMIDETGNAFRWSLQLNPTVDGTFTYSDITNSALQRALGVTANVVSAEGLIIDSGYVGSADKAGAGSDRKFVTSLRMGTKIDGTADTLVLCVTPLDVNSDVQASLTFRELL